MRELMETILFGTVGYVLCIAMKNKPIGILIVLITAFSIVNIASPILEEAMTTIEEANSTINKVEEFSEGINTKIEKADSFLNGLFNKLKFWE